MKRDIVVFFFVSKCGFNDLGKNINNFFLLKKFASLNFLLFSRKLLTVSLYQNLGILLHNKIILKF